MSRRTLRSSTAVNPTGLSGHGSVLVRSRCADMLALLELMSRLGRSAHPGFGMGSVEASGSVGAETTRSVSSAFSHRTGLSELLKIRVSMVRFRPWPPLPNLIRNGVLPSPADHPWPSIADPRTIGKWVGGAAPGTRPTPREFFASSGTGLQRPELALHSDPRGQVNDRHADRA